jgi:hypothetical protein
MTAQQAFIEALVSRQRAPELADVDDLFGFLIGSWSLEAVIHGPNGETRSSRGEVHASWVLEGRAIQDLFIFPRREDRAAGLPSRGDRYATTLRTYDRTLDAWRVRFINPAAEETNAELVARRRGPGIEMEGELADGTPIRWRYVSVTPGSFHYTAEKLGSDGESWVLYLELLGTRQAERDHDDARRQAEKARGLRGRKRSAR